MNKMKILIVGNGATGVKGNIEFLINNHTGNFLNNINQNHSVTFVQYSSTFNTNNDLQNFDLNLYGIQHKEIVSNRNINGYRKLISLIRDSDVVYMFYPGTLGKIVGVLAVIMNKRMGLYVRGENFDKTLIDKFILRRSSFVLTVSNYFRKTLLKYCKDVDVIRPMVSLEQKDFYLRDERSRYPSKFLFVGRVEENKGIFDLIDIINMLNESGKAVSIDIVGGGAAFESIQHQIELNNWSYITLHGLISDKTELQRLYNSSDAFLFTSHFEGFPRVLYEAMASGLPIFTTFVGGIPGLMTDGQNCIEIPVKDSKKASQIIFNVMSDLDLMNKISSNGQNTLRDILSSDYIEHDKLLLGKI